VENDAGYVLERPEEVRTTSSADREEKVIIELTGSRAEHGLPLANFGQFVQNFRRALTDYDRQTVGRPTRRPGHPNVREELVTAFRLTAVRPGSTVLELRPIPRSEVELDGGYEQPALGDAELQSMITLRSLLDAVEYNTELDPSVTSSLSEARRALGQDGQISVRGHRGPRHRVVIDEERIRKLEERARRPEPRPLTVSGRLHRIELEPDKVGIRTPAGVDWTCRYPAELEATVKALLDVVVTAHGVGYQSTAQRGSLEIEQIQRAPQYEQTAFFTEEPVPLEELMAQQGVEARRGPISIAPDDLTEQELADFLEAVDAL
jgi:hypothetical protein